MFEEWDPIGVHTEYDEEDDQRAYWDEYDSYLPEIARRLGAGDEDGLVTYLAHIRNGFNVTPFLPDPVPASSWAPRLIPLLSRRDERRNHSRTDEGDRP